VARKRPRLPPGGSCRAPARLKRNAGENPAITAKETGFLPTYGARRSSSVKNQRFLTPSPRGKAFRCEPNCSINRNLHCSDDTCAPAGAMQASNRRRRLLASRRAVPRRSNDFLSACARIVSGDSPLNRNLTVQHYDNGGSGMGDGHRSAATEKE